MKTDSSASRANEAGREDGTEIAAEVLELHLTIDGHWVQDVCCGREQDAAVRTHLAGVVACPGFRTAGAAAPAVVILAVFPAAGRLEIDS
jgi:hypothetical protein